MGWDGRILRGVRDTIVSSAEPLVEWGKPVLKDAISDLASDLIKSLIQLAFVWIILGRPVPPLFDSPNDANGSGANGANGADGVPTDATQSVAEETVAATLTVAEETTGLAETITGQTTTVTETTTVLAPLGTDILVTFTLIFVVLFVINVAYRMLS